MDSRVTSRDVQEIVSKLSSDKAKAREEGIKLLNTWLEGEKSILFCKYLSEKTASLKPDEIPHSETWPYMVRVLIQCVTSELLSSKRRLPKLNFAKTLRMVVQRAEDPKISGNNLPLLPVAKLLFNHVFDVLKDVASFQSEYAVILRHLLAVHHYRFHMRQRVYSGLVLLYIGKVQASLDIKSSGLSNPKEDVFRCVLTLHSLLESPPGDFPDDLREDIAMGFVKIFTHIRDEGKISRKLIECINTYLLKDGPNIGGRALEIYDAMQQFVFRCWITTHDRSLKDALILYARLQLSLTRGTDDGGPLLEQLLEVLSKELDHLNISNSTLPRSDTSRDDKCGILTASQHALLELAALAFCRACTGSKASFSEKRARREHMVVQIKDRLVKGKWPWHAALCYLIRKYHTRIRKDLIISWFDCICDSLERIINDANMEHVYDGVLWTLRSLQELSALLQFNALRLDSSPNSSFTINEFGKGWDIIWSCLVRCLPTFSNVAYVADAAFTLLSSMIQLDMSSFFTISQDTWDLQLFKCLPTASILRFISCYFSQRVSQGDVRDDLHLRKNLLRSVLAVLNEKEPFTLNERLVVLLPVALYSLSAGCAPLPLYIPEAPDNLWAEDHDYGSQPEYLELSVEVLAKIEFKLGHKVLQPEFCKGVQLPLKLTNVLLRQLETHTVEALKEWENRKMCLRDVFYTCALLCNLIYCSSFTGVQLREDYSFHDKLGHYVIKLMDQASSLVEKTRNDVTSSCVGPDSIFHSRHSVLSSFKCFVCSPLFSNCRNKSDIGLALYTKITQSFERLLKGVAEVFEGCSDYRSDLHPRVDHSDVFDFKVAGGSCPSGGSSSLIVDMELDVHSGSEDVELLPFGGKVPTGLTFSPVNLKMELVLFFSCFFTVLPAMTWDILFDLAGKESNPNVRENLLLSMCRHPYWSSEKNLLGLIMSLNEVIDTQADLKLQSLNALDAICSLVQSLLLLCRDAKHAPSLNFASFDKGLIALGDLVNKIADTDIFDWSSRSKLIDCICNFVLLKPEIGQSMIEKLLLMLRDPDYRVRVTLARQVGALFKTWEGHNELLQDICFNFGAKVVIFSREKIVTAKEVIAAGPQPRVLLETAIVTLMHLALESEKIELEAVFIICAVAAMDPCQRELVGAALDNLSKELCYTSRSKYMEELIGPLLFCWIACGVSLVALVENRKLFVQLMEPSNFMQYCCHWLLPALLLNEDSTNLNWAANVACQPSSMLVKSHFVHIFSVCIALHCSKNAGWEKGSKVLESSILITAEISQDERDKLIKTNMVSIVNFLFSLAAASDDPAPPFFSRNTIKRAIQTVVDGFLEMEDHSRSLGLVDKINIFRPDRVLMFILEIHYKITAATHYRHKCNRLAGIEVLINVLGDRVLISSTFNYLLNVVGQCIGRHALLGQCCRIISTLMMMYKSHPSADITIVLGEQLQFLVSKLVSCCVYSESDGIVSPATSSEIISLLHHIALHPDPSLSEYIKELDSFPDSDLFAEIRRVHEELSEGSSPRNHLVNLAKKSCDLPPRILMPRLKALHKKFFGSEGEEIAKPDLADKHWQSDHDAVNAVWNLVSICRLDAIDSVAALVADFVAKIGIGDPHRVVFDLPGEFTHTHRLTVDNANNLTESVFYMDSGMSEQLLCAVLRLLKKYLMEDSVKIIDLSSQALRGVLSTEMGQRALLSFDLCERSLIEVHSEGVNTEVVQKLVSDLERKFCDETHDVGNSALWTTNDKTFEMWICPVVYALIGFCDDVMLRLCQDIVLVKSEVAELLLPKVMVNIARKRDFNVDLCSLISVQVQEHIFTNSNTLLKSVKVMLDALNALRLCHVFERATTSSASHKREAVKHAKPSTYGSRSRSLSAKQKDDTPSEVPTTLQWPKAYWLPIDYLVAAKSATNCGSYFTALMYVEYWCDEHFKTLTLGSPDFSHVETLAHHIEILISAVTQINEPDSLYGIIQSHKLTSQIVMFEHEGNWTRAFEHYDLLVRSEAMMQKSPQSDTPPSEKFQSQDHEPPFVSGSVVNPKKPLKGLIRSLQKLGCTHVLDVYCQGLASQKSQLPHDLEFAELQYEAAWRAGDWDFSLLNAETSTSLLRQDARACHFNGNLHSCLRALKDGIYNEFDTKLRGAKQELVLCLSNASEESTEYIHSTIVKLQMLQHLGMAWDSRWNMSHRRIASSSEMQQFLTDSVVPASTMDQLSRLNRDWSRMLDQGQLHMDLLEPVIAFRRVLLQILNCEDSQVQHLLDSATTLRKGRRYSQAAASLHEFKSIWTTREEFHNLYWRGRLEEAKLLRAQGQREMAINLAKFISHNVKLDSDASDVFHFLGKWLAESRSSSSKTILEKYLKHAVALADNLQADSPHSVAKQCQMHFHLAHYADALFQSYEERLNSNEWQAAMRLRKLKTKELEALIRRLKSSSKGEQTEYSGKILELQKQLKMDKEEAEKLQEDRDNFLVTALEGYKSCLVIGDKYDVTVVFRLVSLWFGLSGKPIVVNGMLSAIKEVQSYKFIPLAYQIASRMGSKENQGPQNFQFALISLVKKMAIEHPYHTIFQLLALANGDRIKDKQRSKSSFVVDIDKKVAAENLLKEIYSNHGAVIRQMKQMVEIYIKLAELETKREDTNKKITLPREIRGVRELELVPVVTSNFPVDRSCQYPEGSFPHFKGLADSVTVMNGINAPKVVECFGSDGKTYRQLAKSGNDDLRQDAVMEQFFGLVNTFLHSHRDTRRRRLRIRTYKVVPFTPSAGVLEWVNGTIPLGEYLIGSMRNGGAHGRYGVGDWTFLKCRQHMTAESDKRKAFQEVCANFRPVMHYFFLERFSDPADWFEKRLAYTRSVAASSMVAYIVGLGDRHSMNVLIDQGTAEVVHIDLGVAFEQGLMLKTPERVPFRLTRDIIDGMGITGVEGVFRRCCEETLSVMRTNKEALLTIVEVFIHDPLYKWALSPLKALQRQKDIDDDLDSNMEDSDEEEYEGNKDAARALMRVKQKLDGYEESEMRSVHGQVQQLIQDAIDPDRLCHMFPGWGAWL